MTIKHLMITSFYCLCYLSLTACGGPEIESRPPSQQSNSVKAYSGPAPENQDVQEFKLALWDNLSQHDKCGGCHTTGQQAPFFADADNINLAYAASQPFADLSNPKNSAFVAKVGSGHNCWLASTEACGETMTQWVKQWAGDRVAISSDIELVAPVSREAGASKSFPATASLYQQHVYPLVTKYCATCHSQNSAFAQSPFFATPDIGQAYEAAKRVINLDEPSLSRLVLRLGNEFHNCWDDCQANALAMQNAISSFSQNITVAAIPADVVASKALRLNDGLVASSGGRNDNNVIALYQFKTGAGSIAYDTSGVSPAANLTITGNVEWLASWGLRFINGKAQASTATSRKLQQNIMQSGEFSIEAWLTPANVVQEGPARIITYSAGNDQRNFTLGQSQYNYDFMLRKQGSNNNGEPALSTPDADEVLQASLQHVVMSFDPLNGRQIYVNGRLIEVNDDAITPVTAWDDSFALILGNEASNMHTWAGNVRFLAIYNRAIKQEQITTNFDAGVGERFLLLFSIAEQVNLASTYIMFDVSQFDNYSYLFNKPSIVNLDGNNLSQDLNIKGLRIGLNGKEANLGQAFANINRIIDSQTSITSPYNLSQLGTIIPLEKGAQQDDFFLSFDKLGEHEFVRIAEPIIENPITFTEDKQPLVGLRNFAEINSTMSVLTGVEKDRAKVAQTYNLVKRQLPSIENIDTFISAQQMAITQMAIAYCDSAIDDSNIISTWLPAINFSQAPTQALSSTKRNDLINPIIDKFMPLTLSNQADKSLVANELSALIERLSSCGSNCEADRTKTIAKAACTAVLASANLSLQ